VPSEEIFMLYSSQSFRTCTVCLSFALQALASLAFNLTSEEEIHSDSNFHGAVVVAYLLPIRD
jgi:hypothetical protein